jgi:formate dehydrogenase iron-sulfur subunit
VLAEAKRRAEALKDRYPDAQVYGETQAGGLGVIIVAPDEPEKLALPMEPDSPLVSGVWTGVVQPVSLGLTAATAVVAGVAAVIARRNHMQELRQIEAGELVVAGITPGADDDGKEG